VLDANNNDWQAEIGYAESALGILFLENGRAADAVGPFERSLAVDEELVRRIPGDSNQRVNLGQGHAWLADALEKLGRLAQARAHRETELTIYLQILTKDPTIRQAKFSTIVALESMGRLEMIDGDFKGAIENFSNSADRAEALLVNERENMDLTSVVAIAQTQLGEALLGAERLDNARIAQQRGAALLDTALAHDGSVALWRGYRDRAVLLEAAIIGRIGDRTEALRLDQDLLHRFQTDAATAVNTGAFWLLQRCRLQTGDELAALGRLADARKDWEAIAKSLSGPVDSYEPKLLVLLEATQRRLGNTKAAEAITRRLKDMTTPTGDG
jgi:tetratricopeptide (TPR) repeat protein